MNGIFPDPVEIAMVSPRQKTDDKKKISNYRTASVLNIFYIKWFFI